jgi:16S rRNA (uracil1498-N3)-methyltransferase
MKRFLVNGGLSVGSRLELPPEEARHARRVLRLEVGDEVLVTDGRGSEANARIAESSKDGMWVEITSVKEGAARACKVEILQAPLKGPRMDWLVEKLTELGVDALHPVQTERTVAGKDKEDRWGRLVQAAMKQSGNLRALELSPTLTLPEALAAETQRAGLKLLLAPQAPVSLAQALQNGLREKPARILLAIGPEGGFSAAEEELFIRQGFQPVALSRQILRGETAGLIAAAITLHLVDF